MSLTVSIALCTYNGERFLQTQLDSFTNQTRLPDEVIVCDDGSTDKTVEILEKWKKDVAFEVRIIRNEKNLGYAGNFAKAMSLCTKDIIFLCDQDDVWLPEKIEYVTSKFEEAPETMTVYTNAEIVDSNLKSMGMDRITFMQLYMQTSLPLYLSPILTQRSILSGCCCALRKTLVSRLFPPDVFHSHDVCVYICAQLWGYVRTSEKSFLLSRIHEKNSSQKWEYLKISMKEKSFPIYKISTGNYFYWEPLINKVLELVSKEESPGRAKMLKFLRRHKPHYNNRRRVQKNCLLFLPLWVYEILNLRYFHYPQPIRSILYDFACGFRNMWSPAGWCINRFHFKL